MHNQREPTPPNAGEDLRRVFGVRLREERTARALSQAAVAEGAREHGARLDHSGIARIEAGGRAVDLRDAAAIAAALEVPLGELLAPARPDPREELRRLEARVSELAAEENRIVAERQTTEARARRLRLFIDEGEW